MANINIYTFKANLVNPANVTIRDLKRELLTELEPDVRYSIFKKIEELEMALFRGNVCYVESIAEDGAENYVLRDKRAYRKEDSEEELEYRLAVYQNNRNLSEKWKTRMTEVIEYKLRNINSDGYYCQGFFIG